MNQLKITAFALAALAASACGTEVDPLDGPDSPLHADAKDDFVDIEMAGAVTTDVLANDIGVGAYQALEINLPPLAGTAKVTDDGKIYYEPAADYIGADLLTYRVMAANGTISSATMNIDVACEECANGRNIRLRWNPNNPIDTLNGFRIYAGSTEDADKMELVSDLTPDTADFEMENPSVVYDAWYDLGLALNSQVCFRATAYNDGGESDFSNAACRQIVELKWDYDIKMD